MKKYFKYLGVSACVLFATGPVMAQSVALDWAKSIQGKDLDYARRIAVDESGNVITGGHFADTMRMANAGTNSLSLVVPVGRGYDGHVVKQDVAGNFLWARQFSSKGFDKVESVAADRNGNVYVLGTFSDTMDVNPGPGLFVTLNSVRRGYSDVFLAKLDAAGTFLWVKHFGGTEVIEGFSLLVDELSNVYVGGGFKGTMNPELPVVGGTTLTSAGDFDAYVIKLDSSGSLIRAVRFGSTGEDFVQAMALDDNGGMFAVGMFDGNVQFGNNTINAATAGNRYIAKMDTAGTFIWTKTLAVAINDIAADPAGNVFVIGNWYGTAEDFDPDPNVTSLLVAISQDVYILKLDANGIFSWVRQLSSDGNSEHIGMAVTTDRSGNVYSTGSFGTVADFNPDPVLHDTLFTAGLYGYNAFVWKLNADGDYRWAYRLGGEDNSEGNSLVTDRSGNVYTTGTYWGDGEFDPGPGSAMLTHAGGQDIFVHKLICTDTSIVPLRLTLCNERYTAGGRVFDSTGTYTIILPNKEGCDSTILLDLTIDRMEKPEIIPNGFILTVAGNYSYQWLKNGNVDTGATGNTYEVTENGAYRVIATSGSGCSDTSDVYKINNVSVRRLPGAQHDIRIYPNPVGDILYFHTSVPLLVKVISLDGRIVHTAGPVMAINVEDLAHGTYFLQLMDTDHVLLTTEKFVKKD